MDWARKSIILMNMRENSKKVLSKVLENIHKYCLRDIPMRVNLEMDKFQGKGNALGMITNIQVTGHKANQTEMV